MKNSLQSTALTFALLTSGASNVQAGPAAAGANGDARGFLVAAVLGTYSGRCITIQDGTAADGASINLSMSGASGAGIAVDFTDPATVVTVSRAEGEKGPVVAFDAVQFEHNTSTTMSLHHDPAISGAVDQALIRRTDPAHRQTGVQCLNVQAAAVAAIDPLISMQTFLGTSGRSMLCSENGLNQIRKTVGVAGTQVLIGGESIDLASNRKQTDVSIEGPGKVALHILFDTDRSFSMVYTRAGQPSTILYVDSAGELRTCIGQ